MMDRQNSSPRIWLLVLVSWLATACQIQIPVQSKSHATDPSQSIAGSAEAAPAAVDQPQPGLPPAAPTTATESETAQAQGDPPVRADGTIAGETQLMGTRMSIVLWLATDQTPAGAGSAIQEAFNEIARIEAIASEWRDDSDLSRLNRSAGQGLISVAPELVDILRKSKEISAQTDGMFDVSFHAVGQLWKFSPGSVPPTDAEVAAALPHVDWRKIVIGSDGKSVRLKDAGMRLGLGAIAKGYAVDAAAKVLLDAGFHHHIVEGGGDTYVSGTKGDVPWMVGVQNPNGPGSIGAIPAQDVSIVTSGNYERFFEYQGVRYSHILDPRTGRPIPEAVSPKSVTLMAQSATVADAMCTALAVMGHSAGMRFVESRPDLEAVFVTPDGEMLVSSGLKARFRDMRPAHEAQAGPSNR